MRRAAHGQAECSPEVTGLQHLMLRRVALQQDLPSCETLASEASCRFLAQSRLLQDSTLSPQMEVFQQGKDVLKNTLLLKSQSMRKAAVKQESQ